MEAIRLHRKVEDEGEIRLTGLPCHKGDDIELIVLIGAGPAPKPRMRASDLQDSGLVGIWRDRRDLGNSSQYARSLRDEAQQRRLQ